MSNNIPRPYLPDELWLQIFAKLRPYDWCHSVAGVSRRWRKLSSDPWLWRRVNFGAQLAWTEFPVPFLRAKMPLAVGGKGDSIIISSSSSRDTAGLMRPACFIKALTKLRSGFPSLDSLKLTSVRLASDTRQCSCAFHHGQPHVRFKEKEDVLGADASGIVEALLAFPRLRSLALSLNLDLAAKFLSLAVSDPNAAKLCENLVKLDLCVGLW